MAYLKQYDNMLRLAQQHQLFLASNGSFSYKEFNTEYGEALDWAVETYQPPQPLPSSGLWHDFIYFKAEQSVWKYCYGPRSPANLGPFPGIEPLDPRGPPVSAAGMAPRDMSRDSRGPLHPSNRSPRPRDMSRDSRHQDSRRSRSPRRDMSRETRGTLRPRSRNANRPSHEDHYDSHGTSSNPQHPQRPFQIRGRADERSMPPPRRGHSETHDHRVTGNPVPIGNRTSNPAEDSCDNCGAQDHNWRACLHPCGNCGSHRHSTRFCSGEPDFRP